MKKFTWTTVDAMSCCNLPVLLCVLGWAARLPNRLGCDLERGHMQLAKNVGRYFSTRQDEPRTKIYKWGEMAWNRIDRRSSSSEFT